MADNRDTIFIESVRNQGKYTSAELIAAMYMMFNLLLESLDPETRLRLEERFRARLTYFQNNPPVIPSPEVSPECLRELLETFLERIENHP